MVLVDGSGTGREDKVVTRRRHIRTHESTESFIIDADKNGDGVSLTTHRLRIPIITVLAFVRINETLDDHIVSLRALILEIAESRPSVNREHAVLSQRTLTIAPTSKKVVRS